MNTPVPLAVSVWKARQLSTTTPLVQWNTTNTGKTRETSTKWLSLSKNISINTNRQRNETFVEGTDSNQQQNQETPKQKINSEKTATHSSLLAVTILSGSYCSLCPIHSSTPVHIYSSDNEKESWFRLSSVDSPYQLRTEKTRSPKIVNNGKFIHFFARNIE